MVRQCTNKKNSVVNSEESYSTLDVLLRAKSTGDTAHTTFLTAENEFDLSESWGRKQDLL